MRRYLFIMCLLACVGCAGQRETLPDALQAELQELAALRRPAQVDPHVWEELTGALRALLLARGTSEAPSLAVAKADPIFDAQTGELSWEYVNPGDYDQNGVVTISDITPLAVHFGATGPFTAGSVRTQVDGDSNGQINLADITPIGANLGLRVEGYYVYRGTSFPAESAKAVSAPGDPAGTMKLNEAHGAANTDRLRFTYLIADALEEEFFWVTPYDGIDIGIISLPGGGPGEWTTVNVPGISGSQNFGLAGGWPCTFQAEFGGLHKELRFARALDRYGLTWPEPTVLYERDALDDDIEYIYIGDVINVEGRVAAVAHEFYGSFNNDYFFKWVLADDAAATGFEIYAPYDYLRVLDGTLQIVDGHPAAFAVRQEEPGDGVQEILCFVRAADALGTTWLPPVDIQFLEPSPGMFNVDIGQYVTGVINSMPMIAYAHRENPTDWYFAHASDGAGEIWPLPVTVGHIDSVNPVRLFTLDSTPALAYTQHTGFEYVPTLRKSLDAFGIQWSPPAGPTSETGRILAVHEYPVDPIMYISRIDEVLEQFELFPAHQDEFWEWDVWLPAGGDLNTAGAEKMELAHIRLGLGAIFSSEGTVYYSNGTNDGKT